MRSLLLPAVMLICLACTPSTTGLGDGGASSADADTTGDGDIDTGTSAEGDSDTGDGDGDADTSDGTGDGDGDGDPDTGDGDGDSCAEISETVVIEGYGPGYDPESCEKQIFDFVVVEAANNVLSMVECPCTDLTCDGPMHTLTLHLPELVGWLPPLDEGSCGRMYLYPEPTSGDACRQARVDMTRSDGGPLFYSAGSSQANLDKNGLAVTPVNPTLCSESCADWELRNLLYEIDGESIEVAFDDQDSIVTAASEILVRNWHAYQMTPTRCAEAKDVIELATWTAVREAL